ARRADRAGHARGLGAARGAHRRAERFDGEARSRPDPSDPDEPAFQRREVQPRHGRRQYLRRRDAELLPHIRDRPWSRHPARRARAPLQEVLALAALGRWDGPRPVYLARHRARARRRPVVRRARRGRLDLRSRLAALDARGTARAGLRLPTGALEHIDDLFADQLVPVEQRVTKRDHEVLVLVEERLDAALFLLQQGVHAPLSVAVAEHAADETGVEHTFADGAEGDERTTEPERTDHLRR